MSIITFTLIITILTSFPLRFLYFLRNEPDAVRVLRAVLGGDCHHLDNSFIPREINAPDGSLIALVDVLGQGSFGTVFHGIMRHSGALCAVKAHRIDGMCSREDFVAQITHEEKVLQQLPQVIAYNGTRGSRTVLLLQDVGVTLARYLHGKTKAARRNIARTVERELIAGLDAALRVGYCHADLRPDNVLFVQRTGHFQIVDWSLCVQPHTLTHPHKGGKAFFADSLVLAADSDDWPALFDPRFDRESVFYIACSVVIGGRNLSVPWAGDGGQALVDARNREIAKEGI